MSTAKLHILVALDFSDSATVALSHAVKLAALTGARLHLAHIVDGDGFVVDANLGLNTPGEFPAAKEARVQLQRVLAHLAAQVDAEVHVRINKSPTAGILALIQELRPDMVIAGSHGKGVIERTLLGSVSRDLVERSPVPVLISPAPGRELLVAPPASPAEPDLPSVGVAVASTGGGGVAWGIAGVGGGEVNFR